MDRSDPIEEARGAEMLGIVLLVLTVTVVFGVALWLAT